MMGLRYVCIAKHDCFSASPPEIDLLMATRGEKAQSVVYFRDAPLLAHLQ